jgi:tRNA dimethylallyltransferase
MGDMPVRDSWFLTGPTASGKSAVGVELARRIGAEIISLDSIAVYRGMDIGTAKATPDERRVAPHHLIDVLDPWEEFSLAQYVEAAGQVAAEIAGRGRQVLFVGGTPLYLKGLLRGIFQGPPADWELRRRLADEAQLHAAGWLHERLAAVDPVAASRLHPNDARRLIRAIEVFEKTGRPISELQRQFDVGRTAADCRVFVLDWPREELYRRIDRRVEEMFSTGLVEEVRRLLAGVSHCTEETDYIASSGADIPVCPMSPGFPGRQECLPHRDEKGRLVEPHPLSRTARQAVGYREVIEHLQGRRGLPETVELVQRHTRQLAKRQSTWFRSLSECRFIAVSSQLNPSETAEQIVSASGALADDGNIEKISRETTAPGG